MEVLNLLSRVMGISAMGAGLMKAKLVQRFVGDITKLLSLAIVTGLTTGALVIGVFYVIYEALVYYGLQPLPAQVCVGLLALATVITLYNMIAGRLRKLRGIPERIVHTEFPFSHHLNELADNFMDGFLKGQSAPPRN